MVIIKIIFENIIYVGGYVKALKMIIRSDRRVMKFVYADLAARKPSETFAFMVSCLQKTMVINLMTSLILKSYTGLMQQN